MLKKKELQTKQLNAYSITNRKVLGHTCDLMAQEDTVVEYIYGGMYVNFRRKFRKFLMIDPNNPQTKSFLKSTAKIRTEERRHLSKHYHTIHPFSRQRSMWETIMIFVYLIYLIVIPLDLCFVSMNNSDSLGPGFIEFATILDILGLIDIGLFFVTGYHDKSIQKVILKSRTIVCHYVTTYFFFDLVSTLPYTAFIHICTKDLKSASSAHIAYYFKFLQVFKLVRIFTMFEYLKRLSEIVRKNCGDAELHAIRMVRFILTSFLPDICGNSLMSMIKYMGFCTQIGMTIPVFLFFTFKERVGFWNYNLRLINFLIGLILAVAWATCIHFISTQAGTDDNVKGASAVEDSKLISILQSTYEVILFFFLIGMKSSRIVRANVLEICCLIVGSILNMIMLAHIIQICQRQSSSRDKYNRLVRQIEEYMKYKELPPRLRQRVFHYVDFKFQKHVYKEADILNTLSSILQQDILLHSCKNLVEKVDFFRDLPTTLLLRLVSKLRSEIYLPNDVIVQAGITGNAMYFIYIGTVVVYTRTGKEICHLQDGSHFGEIALVINEPRTATVVAIRECELFRLSRKDFQEAIHPFPEFGDKIRTSAMTRLENTMRLMTDVAEE